VPTAAQAAEKWLHGLKWLDELDARLRDQIRQKALMATLGVRGVTHLFLCEATREVITESLPAKAIIKADGRRFEYAGNFGVPQR
jgi:hypothetical protein